MRKRLALSIGMLALVCSGTVEAGPITYTETVTGSGSLDGQGFTNALITITGTGDTTNISGSGPLRINIVSTTVTIAGGNSDTFQDVIQAVANNNAGTNGSVAGFGDVTNKFFLLGTSSPALATYDLATPIGPIADRVIYNPGLTFKVTGGIFRINSVSSLSTFTASTSAAVPEPASLAMMGLGLALAATAARSRARKSPKSPA